MPKWEYQLVRARVWNVGKSTKDLDPKITNWDELTWHDTVGDRAWVAWSERGCWTRMSTMLDEMGAAGWELVGTTPEISIIESANVASAGRPWPQFDYIFKRSQNTKEGG